jgi:hypothetical protein
LEFIVASECRPQVVILDTCHSGNDTLRGIPLTRRSVPTKKRPPANLDVNIWASVADIPLGFRSKHVGSHVVLSACQAGEFAYEFASGGGHHGFFTKNLVEQLEEVALDQISYSELFNLIPGMTNQKPFCTGVNTHLILFRKFLQQRAHAITRKGNTIKVDVGSIHGITHGTEFVVRGESTGEVFVTTRVGVQSSILEPRYGDSSLVLENEKVLVTQRKGPALKVFVDPGSWSQLSQPIMSRSQDAPRRGAPYTIVSSQSQASIAIRLEPNGDLTLNRLDAHVSAYAGRIKTFELNNQIHKVPDILDAIAYFNAALGIHHGGNPLEGKVSIELHQQQGPRTRVAGNLLRGNRAIITEGEYAVTLFNESKYDLFAQLVCFNPSPYSIEVCTFHDRDADGRLTSIIGLLSTDCGEPLQAPKNRQSLINIFQLVRYSTGQLIRQRS